MKSRFRFPRRSFLMALVVLGSACSMAPRLVLSPQPFEPLTRIPDGLLINLYTASPRQAYRLTAGRLVPTPFVKALSSQSGRKPPLAIHTKRHIEDTVVIPPDGMVVVLTSTEHWGLWPLELLFMVAGHPVPHNTLYLEVFSPTGAPLFEARCLKGTYLSAGLGWAP